MSDDNLCPDCLADMTRCECPRCRECCALEDYCDCPDEPWDYDDDSDTIGPEDSDDV